MMSHKLACRNFLIFLSYNQIFLYLILSRTNLNDISFVSTSRCESQRRKSQTGSRTKQNTGEECLPHRWKVPSQMFLDYSLTSCWTRKRVSFMRGHRRNSDQISCLGCRSYWESGARRSKITIMGSSRNVNTQTQSPRIPLNSALLEKSTG